jgi:hypothetical protein
VRLEWRQAADADVLSARAIENQAIYVWLSFQDNAEPRAYVLPWSQRAAEQLQAAQQTAGEQGTGIRVKLPFDSFADSDEHRFYAMPQMPLPPKNAQSNAGAMYAEP